MHGDTWQLVLVDLLFLGLAGTLGFWFRAWLKEEKRALDQRLRALEAQEANLERLGGRLQNICQFLESLVRAEESAVGERREAPAAAATSPPAGEAHRRAAAQGGRDERYEQARELLTRGMQPADVARRLGLGVADVESINRVLGLS